MAEDPFYVNVRRKKKPRRIPKQGGPGRRSAITTTSQKNEPNKAASQTVPRSYTNIVLPDSKNEDCDQEGYQVVQEQGLNPAAEYTDLTVTQPDEATMRREKLINDFLFPPQKDAPKRFNYTDVQLAPANPNEEDNTPSHVVKKQQPTVRPKPRFSERISDTFEENGSYAAEEGQEAYHCDAYSCTSWKCCGIATGLVLLGVCVALSLVAVALGTAAVIRSVECEQNLLQAFCNITLTPTNPTSTPTDIALISDNCTTPSIPDSSAEQKVTSTPLFRPQKYMQHPNFYRTPHYSSKVFQCVVVARKFLPFLCTRNLFTISKQAGLEITSFQLIFLL